MIRLALLLVMPCCAPAALAPLHPRAEVPLSVWTFTDERCESYLWEPATFCNGKRVHDFDGCAWRCLPAPIEGARQ